jgi:hypothetical protein
MMRHVFVLAIGAWLGLVSTSVGIAAEQNVAPLGFAEQSTTGFGGGAERANDGNTSGLYGDNTVSHTDVGDVAPWWQVDLGDEYPLTRIVLWNRTDCCSPRLSNFRVSVLDGGQSEVHGEDFFTDGIDYPNPSLEVVLPEGTEGEFVRVDILGNNAVNEIFLSLAEVEAFTTADVEIPATIALQPVGARIAVGEGHTFEVVASGTDPIEYQWYFDGGEIDGATSASYVIAAATIDDAGSYTVRVSNAAGEDESLPAVLTVVDGVNIAREGTASQSTTDFGGDPARGNDGNVSGNYGDNSVTHTGNDPLGWWEVSFPGPSRVDSIMIWNRTDCCSQRLTNIRVRVLDAARADIFAEDHFTDGSFPDTTIDGFEIPDIGVENARFVRVEFIEDPLRAEPWLSLAEVEVFGETDTSGPGPCPEAGAADFADTHCGGVDITPPALGAVGIYGVAATATDATGDVINYTFTADNGVDAPIVIGPQTSSSANVFLRIGSWTISVEVDDREDCADRAEDASCSTTIEVEPSDPDNVAVFGTATQSSTGFGGGPLLAIDDNTSGQFGSGSITHTDTGDPAPWWEVELAEETDIDRIVIWNRMDCCSERLTNFRVSVLDAERGVVFEEDFFTDFSFPDTSIDGFEIPIEGGAIGLIVRVEFIEPELRDPGQLYLSLSEVQVFRRSDDPTGRQFTRADADASSAINITDGIFVLNFLFLGGDDPTCVDAADADDSGSVNITDGIFILNFLFLGGANPPAPWPACGEDTTEDASSCLAQHPSCA